MKLVTSTGDFWFYKTNYYDAIQCFKDTKFKYINLELTKNLETFYSDNDDDCKRLTEELEKARFDAGVSYVTAHAPCLKKYYFPDEEGYRNDMRAICRSVEIAHELGIERIVVHPLASKLLTEADYYKYNEIFYRNLLDKIEKYGVMIMIENLTSAGSYMTTGKQMYSFLESINHPLLAACFDTAHCNLSSEAKELGSYRNIIDLGKHLKGLHISDNFGTPGCHHHTWPFAGTINFDSVINGLLDVGYDGYFTFEASYTLLHEQNNPYHRQPFIYNGETVTKLLNPSLELKKKAVDLLYDTGKYMLEAYNCFEE